MDADAEREFREFVAARSAALTRSAYLLTGQREAAEDLLQTVLARVARRWRKISAEPDLDRAVRVVDLYTGRVLAEKVVVPAYRKLTAAWLAPGRGTPPPAAVVL